MLVVLLALACSGKKSGSDVQIEKSDASLVESRNNIEEIKTYMDKQIEIASKLIDSVKSKGISLRAAGLEPILIDRISKLSHPKPSENLTETDINDLRSYFESKSSNIKTALTEISPQLDSNRPDQKTLYDPNSTTTTAACWRCTYALGLIRFCCVNNIGRGLWFGVHTCPNNSGMYCWNEEDGCPSMSGCP